MKLKTLAGLVCIALGLQLALSLFDGVTRHYLTTMYVGRLVLSVPMILFFFFVWKRQKA